MIVVVQEGEYEEREEYWFETDSIFTAEEIEELAKRAKKMIDDAFTKWQTEMQELCRRHNRYDLLENSGYITAAHENYEKLGVSEDLHKEFSEICEKLWPPVTRDLADVLIELSQGKLHTITPDINVEI